ncbi:cytochrome b/b6 domain-containing protein [Hydrogenophilus thiooxidans]|uniref:cytochrome b/b6 domain-containing protein n=1 Tax=Hydrogenophilus thiooxidans TaxID=2820326 RepID=UPI001C21F8ED|nr:cytochrome b/b6 domain-containing protein [Hydrogenophilus thiooxidans]
MSQNGYRIPVWDPLLRLFHWALVACVIGAFVSVKLGGNAIVWHGAFGVAICGLLAFRLVWGVIGPQTARFSQFVKGPAAIRAYFQGAWHGIGHNPLGALSVVAMLAAFGCQAVLGLFSYDEIAFRGPLALLVSEATQLTLTGWHRRLEPVLIALVALHLAAILFYRVVKREDLVRPMITGYRVWLGGDQQNGQGRLPNGINWRTKGYWVRGGAAIALAVAAAVVASGAWVAPPPPVAVTAPEW